MEYTTFCLSIHHPVDGETVFLLIWKDQPARCTSLKLESHPLPSSGPTHTSAWSPICTTWSMPFLNTPVVALLVHGNPERREPLHFLIYSSHTYPKALKCPHLTAHHSLIFLPFLGYQTWSRTLPLEQKIFQAWRDFWAPPDYSE